MINIDYPANLMKRIHTYAIDIGYPANSIGYPANSIAFQEKIQYDHIYLMLHNNIILLDHSMNIKHFRYSILLNMLMLDWLDSHVKCMASRQIMNGWLPSQSKTNTATC
jgi:hypothetical protein